MNHGVKEEFTLPGYTAHGEPFPRQCSFCDEPSFSGVKFPTPEGAGSNGESIVLGVCQKCAFKIGYPPDVEIALKVLEQTFD